jgi:type VI secretion system secreted protein VgrG
MAVIRSGNKTDYTLKIGSLPIEKLRVVQFFGNETISELFHYSFDIASTDGELNFDDILGQPAHFTINGPKGKRHLHGIVSHFEQRGKGIKFTSYQAEVVPALWILSRRHNCRIFQNQTIPDIIKKILTDGGIPSDQFKFSLKKNYQPRDYCVQYRESDLSFISRLMEQYGIFYFFEHTDQNHLMVIGDASDVHLAIPAPDTVIFKGSTAGSSADLEHIFEYQVARGIQSGLVRLRDFDFKKPRLSLEQKSEAEKDHNLFVYDFPGEYETPSEGGGLTKIRLEEIQMARETGSGQSDCRRFIAGYRFKLDQSSRTDFNREYLLTRISHSGSEPQALEAEAGENQGDVYRNHFECIPSDIPFRPRRMTPKPFVQGPQTAIVVGPKGEEIHTDEFGRIKVQFHWDRDGKQNEKTSCWVRVSQIWAGAGWGAMFIPRIGHEVIVEFLEGDPDRPIVTGGVYNGENKPPYALPDNKTKSTIKSNTSKGGGGSNELRFEDAKGSEEIYLHGQKDWTIAIENDKNQTIGHDETLDVKSNRTKTVGKDQSESIGDNKSITVGKNHSESIGENAGIDVGKDETISIGKNQSISIGENMTLTVGKNLSESVSDNSDSSVGKNFSGTVGKKGTLDIGEDMGITVGKKLNILAADQINIFSDKQICLKAGDASIALKQNGDIIIKGGKISIKADGDIVMKGSKVTAN